MMARKGMSRKKFGARPGKKGPIKQEAGLLGSLGKVLTLGMVGSESDPLLGG